MGNILLLSMVESTSTGCLCSTPSAFTLQSNGVTLARIEQPTDNSDGCVISLLGSRNIDLRTKALVIFSGYTLVSLHRFEEVRNKVNFEFSRLSTIHSYRKLSVEELEHED